MTTVDCFLDFYEFILYEYDFRDFSDSDSGHSDSGYFREKI